MKLVSFTIQLRGRKDPINCKVDSRILHLLGGNEVMELLKNNAPKVVLAVGDITGHGSSVGFSELLEKKHERATFPFLERRDGRKVTILLDSIPKDRKRLIALTLTRVGGSFILRERVVQRVSPLGRVFDWGSFNPQELVMC